MDKRNLIRHGIRWTLAAAATAVLVLGALELAEREAEGEAVAAGPAPARVEPLGKTGLSRVILTPRAAERLGLETALVRARGSQVLVPYSALLYDENGKTWVYTRPKRLTFVRAPVTVAMIRRDDAILSAGPRAGTVVATVGAAELLGAEFEVDH